MADRYDLVVVGAGSGGLVAARFAAQLGARVALVEQGRVGGDCTWTGCVPSKALIRAARVAHDARTAAEYGIQVAPPVVDMARVREYVRGAIDAVYQFETPETLAAEGISVIPAPGRFAGPQTLVAGDHRLSAKAFLLCTGACPRIPPIPGLDNVPYLTTEAIFENDRLPVHLIVLGGGPVGLELAQAYRRLGAAVTVIAPRLLPREDAEAGGVLGEVFDREGLRVIPGKARAVRRDGPEIVVTVGAEDVRGDLLLLATGRAPGVADLGLDAAGVVYSAAGIRVDKHLRTSVKHIYAAGDCLGGPQYTHLAGWQAFQAARNALLPGESAGFSDAVPRVTFTDPEVAQVGLTEATARQEYGAAVQVTRWDMAHTDRAVCEHALAGFYKLIHEPDGTLLGATIVAARAGEAITECVIALSKGWKVSDLAAPIHAYPTYSTAIQQLAAEVTIRAMLGGVSGQMIRGLFRLGR